MNDMRRYRQGEVGPNAGRPLTEAFSAPVPVENQLPPEEHQRRVDRQRSTLAVIPSSIVRAVPTAGSYMLQTGRQLYHGITGPEETFFDRFMAGRYAQGKAENVNKFVDMKIEEFQVQNPAATDDDVNEFIEKFRQSEEFRLFERAQLPEFMQRTERYSDAVDTAFGAPRDDEKTNFETVLAMGSEAALPIKLFKGLATAPRLAAEFMMPGNQAETNLGKAAVVSIAGGITAGINYLLERDVSEDVMKTPEQIQMEMSEIIDSTYDMDDSFERPDAYADKIEALKGFGNTFKEQLMTGIASIAAVAAPPGVVRSANRQHLSSLADNAQPSPGLKDRIVDEVKSVANDPAQALREGTAVERSVRDAMGVSPLRGWSPTDKGLAERARQVNQQIAERGINKGYVDRFRAEEFGEFGTTKIPPVNRLVDLRQNMQTAGTYDQVESFVKARDFYNDYMIDEVFPKQKAIDDLGTQLNVAVNAQDNASIRSLSAKLNQAMIDLDAAKAAVPQKYIDALANPPVDDVGKAFVKMHDDINAGVLDEMRKTGFIDDHTYYSIKGAHGGSYTPTQVDRLAFRTKDGRKVSPTGMERAWLKVKSNFSTNAEKNIDTGNRSMALSPRNKGKYVEPENAIDTVDSMKIMMQRHIQAMNQASHKRAWYNAIKAEPNFTKVAKQVSVKQGNTKTYEFSDRSFAALPANVQKELLRDTVQVYTQGGKYQFIRPQPAYMGVLQSFNHAPSVSIPVARGVAKFKSFALTNVLDPLMAPALAMYDLTSAAVARPSGRVFGVDWIADTIHRGMTGKPLPDKLYRGINMIPGMVTADMLVGVGVMAPRAVQAYARKAKVRIVQQTMQSLAADTGFMKHAVKIPGFKPWFEEVVSAGVDGFTDEFQKMMLTSGAVTGSEMKRNHRALVDYAKTFVHYSNTLDMSSAPIRETFIQASSMFEAVRESMRVHYILVNEAHLAAKYGGADKIPKREINKLLSDGRTVSGDFLERPGSKAVQGFASMTPFFNPMLAGAKNVWSRMTHDPRVAATFMNGIVVPQIFVHWYMNNWDEEADKYFNSQPAWRRATGLYLIRPDILARRAMGEDIPFDPDYLYHMSIEHVYRPIITGVMSILDAMGMFGDTTDGGVRQNSYLPSLSSGIGQAFGTMTPPIVDIPLQHYTGLKIDMGARMSGMGDFISMPNDPDRSERTLNENSNIPNWVMDLAMSVAGTFGSRVIHGFDAGLQTYDKEGNVVDALYNGVKEFTDRSMELKMQPIPFATGAWAPAVASKKYRSNPLSTRSFELREVMTLATGGLGAGGRAQAGVKTDEPVMAAVIDTLKVYARSAETKQFTEEFREIRDTLKRLESIKGVPYANRQKAIQAQLQRQENFYERQNRWMMQIQTELMNTPLGDQRLNDLYQQTYEEPLDFEHLAKRLKQLRLQQ